MGCPLVTKLFGASLAVIGRDPVIKIVHVLAASTFVHKNLRAGLAFVVVHLMKQLSKHTGGEDGQGCGVAVEATGADCAA
jgi:hypothetical protein